MLPYVRTFEPDLSAYRRQPVRVFRPSRGKVFLIGRIPNLRLCCFSAVGIAQQYFRRQVSRLANYLLRRVPTIPTVAEELFVAEAIRQLDSTTLRAYGPDQNSVTEGLDENDDGPFREASTCSTQNVSELHETDGEELDEVDDAPVRAERIAAEQRFLDIQKADGEHYQVLLRRTRGLLDAAILGIPDYALATFLEKEHGVTTRGNVDNEHSIELLADSIVPELQSYRADPTVDIVWARRGRSAQDAVKSQGFAAHPDSFPGFVRNVLRTSGGDQLFQDPDRSGIAGETPNPASGTHYMHRGRTLGGRVTICASPPVVRQLEILQSADEVMMDVAFALVAEGHRLVGLAGDEFVVEVPDSEVDQLKSKICDLAHHAAARYLGAITPSLEVNECDEW